MSKWVWNNAHVIAEQGALYWARAHDFGEQFERLGHQEPACPCQNEVVARPVWLEEMP